MTRADADAALAKLRTHPLYKATMAERATTEAMALELVVQAEHVARRYNLYGPRQGDRRAYTLLVQVLADLLDTTEATERETRHA